MSQEKRLLIGIPGFQNSEKMFGVTGNYMHFAERFGDVRIIMPHEEFVEVDLLILPGGLDLSPTSYGRIPSYQTSNHDVFKEFFFENRLETYINRGVPVFGICLGFQMLNAFFGGTLTQHIPLHAQSRNRWEKAHDVILTQEYLKLNKEIEQGKKKAKDVKIPTMEVNSHHHQGVCIKYDSKGEVLTSDLADGFYVIAHVDEPRNMRIIEAFKHNTLPIAGVQYHPEEMLDELSKSLINSIIAMAKKPEEQPLELE